MVVTAKGSALTLKDLPKEVRESRSPKPAPRGALPKEAAELENIQKALAETQGNRTKAADLLGITRKTLFNKMKKHQLE